MIDLAELGRDMAELKKEATALPLLVQEAFKRIATVGLDMNKFVEELGTARDEAVAAVGEVNTALGAWQQQALQAHHVLDTEDAALQSVLDHHQGLLKERREQLGEDLRHVTEVTGVFQKDLDAQAQALETAHTECVTGLEKLGTEGHDAEEMVRDDTQAAQLEADQTADAARAAADGIELDLTSLGQTMETQAEEAVQRATALGGWMKDRVDALNTAVTDAIDELGTAETGFTQTLTTAVDAELKRWETALQGAIDGTGKLKEETDHASERVSKAAGKLDDSFSVFDVIEDGLKKVIGEVKDAAISAGLDWLL